MLKQKIEQSKQVIEDALYEFPSESSLIAWSAGKDSTLVLKLTLDVCTEKNIPFPRVIDIDQNDQFEEITNFRDKLVKDWNLDLIIVKNTDFLQHANNIGDAISTRLLDDTNKSALHNIGYTEPCIIWVPDAPVCNHLLKTLPVNDAIQQQNIKALYTGIRWDEHKEREQETYFSERTRPEHTRVHPILHFTERDIWNATFELNIPYNELYIKGYRSLGSKTGSTKSSSIPAWEQDLENSSERAGRSPEKEKMMKELRAWGYI